MGPYPSSPDPLELARNALEIRIFHTRDHLRDVLTFILVVSALGTLLALTSDRSNIATTALAAVFAYCARRTESRWFGVFLSMLGVAGMFDYPRLLVPGHSSEPGDWRFRIILFVVSLHLLGVLAELGHLKARRAAIPLPPAPHLHLSGDD